MTAVDQPQSPTSKPVADPEGRRRWFRTAVSLLVTLACLVLVAWNVFELRSWAANRDQLTQLLVDFGLEEFNQTALRRISRERSPHQAKLIASRAIVHQVMSPDLDERGLPIIGTDRRVQALDEAEALARQALQAESESWQASMLIGASIYLRRSLASDRRLVTEAADWEVPLRRAVEAASSKTEPRRILAAAYLETWPYLSADKKSLTRELLVHVFRNDESALRRLAPLWLQLAANEDEAMSVVPDNAASWQFIKYTYGRALRWGSYARAQEGLFDALETELTAQLDDAEQRKRLGDEDTSRTLCLQVIQRAPRQLRFVPYVERALQIFPAGLRNVRANDGPQDWLQWAVRLDTVDIRPFPPEVVDGLMAIGGGGMDAPIAAHAALLADNAYNVGRFERQTAFKANLDWAPFLLAKARRLAELETLEEVEDTLDDLDLASRRSYNAWRVRAMLAEMADDEDAQLAAQAEIQQLEDRRWSALEWDLHEKTPYLFMVPSGTGRGLRLEVIDAGPRGDAVEVHFDGRLVALREMTSGQHYDLIFDIEPQPHLLHVVSASGQPTTLGSVTLLQ